MPVARARHKIAGACAAGVCGGGRCSAGVLSGLAAGCHVIAVNAPADTPRLNEVDLVLHSLEQITVTKQPNGDVIIQ
ncbi:putative phosphatase [Shigella sonnei]|nr:putative phosphatase [Shigella sonnei]